MKLEVTRRKLENLAICGNLTMTAQQPWVKIAIFIYLFIWVFFPFIFISWRLITLQYCSGFCHTLTWISRGFTCVPPPASLPIPTHWVFPVYQLQALVSRIQPGLVICFTLDNIHVSMLFSRNIPPLLSPTESKSLFCTSVYWKQKYIKTYRKLKKKTLLKVYFFFTFESLEW